MRVETLFDILDSDFYTGVPDSQLQALCNFLIDKYGISEHHVIAATKEIVLHLQLDIILQREMYLLYICRTAVLEISLIRLHLY